MLEKTVVRAPLSGTILRKHLKSGESVIGSMGATNTPIVTLADTSVLRVHMDVDETDVAKLKTGQKAYVKADAYGDKQFQASVFRIGEILGKKNIRTDEPSEKVDTKILEVLLELEPNSQLKPGLRVDAFISAE